MYDKSKDTTPKPAAEAVVNLSKPPYPFRTAVALLLLAINLVVAGIYFRVFTP